jgi:hypothetical protein
MSKKPEYCPDCWENARCGHEWHGGLPYPDTQALAMALQLADLIERQSLGIIWSGTRMSDGDAMLIARWLRAEVQRELEAQP